MKWRAWLAVARLHFYGFPALAYTLGAVAASAGSHTQWYWDAYLLGGVGLILIEFITVLTNELSDFTSDRVNQNAGILTGGSRMLVEGRLSQSDLRRGRQVAFILLGVVLGVGLWLIPHAKPMFIVATLGVLFGLAYSAPPIRLSARGLGEVAVAVTHSFFAVLGGHLSQARSPFSATPWLLATPLCLAVLPSIILAGFPDVEADEATEKRTLAVRIGRRRSACLAGSFAVLAAFLPLVMAGPVRWIALPAIPHSLWFLIHLGRYLRRGVPAGRIDLLLIISLTFMLWFSIVPLVALLVGGG